MLLIMSPPETKITDRVKLRPPTVLSPREVRQPDPVRGLPRREPGLDRPRASGWSVLSRLFNRSRGVAERPLPPDGP